MQINVAQLLKWPVGTTRIHPIDTDQPLQLDDERTVTLTSGRVRLDRINTGILARGDAEGTVILECGRCLEPYEAAIKVHFEEEFAPSVEVHTGAPLAPPEDDLIFVIDGSHILPIHSPSCLGLCPICGGNRNLDPCTCVADEEGNRPFAALRSLLN
jgi:uncharacterized protein